MTDKATKMIADFIASNTLPPVIICIGTDKVSGDAFGPTVGTLLTRLYRPPCFVYGTLDRPITAVNLLHAVDFVRSKHNGQPIIAVDCALGKSNEIGALNVFKGGLRAGLGVGKRLPPVGELSVTAVVEELKSSHLLSAVKPKLVLSLAIDTCNAIAEACRVSLPSPYYINNTVST